MAFVQGQPGQGGPREPKKPEAGGEEWCDSGLGSLSEGQLVQLREDGGLGAPGDAEGGPGGCPVTSDPRNPPKSEGEGEEGRLDSALGGDEGVGDLVEGVGGVHLQSQVGPEAWLRHVLGFVTEDGDTALHLAVIHEHEAFLDSILQYTHGTDYLDIQNDLGQTALHIAVILGASSFVGKLVSAGAGLGIQEKGGHTALHLACREGWRDCAEQLLAPLAIQRPGQGNRFQAQLDCTNYDGYIPLHVAILRKDLDMVSLLISAGSDLNKQVPGASKRDLHGAFNRAVNKQLLCLGVTSTAFQELSCGRSPLHLAVESQSPEMVEYLLRAGADTEARMYVGYTPMYSAVHRPDQKIPQLLREFGSEEPEWDSEESVDSNSEEEYDDIVINCGH